jgi:hypothetical protein
MKRKVKRYNGEDESLVEVPRRIKELQESDPELNPDVGERLRRASSGSAIKPIDGEGGYTSSVKDVEEPQTFKQAFASARRGGDKTFTWQGKKYTTELASDTKRKSAPDESAAETARLRRVPQASKEEMDRRSRMEREQALETSSPETALIGGPSLRAVHGAAKALAAKEGAKNLARRIEPSFSAMKDITPRAKQIGKEPLKIGREPLKLGMKKGGVVSASKRADGIAQRGKTRGRIC